MKSKKGRRLLGRLLLIALLALMCASCSEPENRGNYPYEPDTPAPDPHSGVFISDYGMLAFNGDGESITVTAGPELAELFEIPEGEYEGKYVFLSGDLPPNGSVPVRYDTAHELELDLNINGQTYSKVFDCGIAADDGSTATVGVGIVTEEMIPLLFAEEGLFFDIKFIKE